jgi:hypothetical protein
MDSHTHQKYPIPTSYFRRYNSFIRSIVACNGSTKPHIATPHAYLIDIIHWERIIVMEEKDAVILTLQSLNLKLVKEVSKLRGEQERSKICLQNMCTYFSRDFGLIGILMEEHQAQVDTWTTHINEMEEKFTLLNEHFLVDLKEKEDIIACLQKDLQQSLASNTAFALLTTLSFLHQILSCTLMVLGQN